MSRKVPINTQEIDYEIRILVNDHLTNGTYTCMDYCAAQPEPGLSEDEIEILHGLNLFNIEKYSDKVDPIDPESMTKETKLIKSIHSDLCPTEEQLQRHMKHTIHFSAFTIFINNKNPAGTYHPFCIATISALTYENRRNSSRNYKYFYINTFCGSRSYTKCAYHLMNIIKMIAYHFGYKYIKLTSVKNKKTLKWYKSQDFIMKKYEDYDDEDEYEHYYKITEEDQYYERSEIKGTCKVLGSSPSEGCISSASSLSSMSSNTSKESVSSKSSTRSARGSSTSSKSSKTSRKTRKK